MDSRIAIASHASRAALILSIATVTASGLRAPAQDQREANLGEIERSKALISEFYELQKQIDAAEARGRSETQILDARLDLLTIEITNLREDTAKKEATITETDEERSALDTENKELDSAQGTYLDAVEKMEERVRELMPKLPDPLQQKVADFVKNMPDPDTRREEVDMDLSSRFATALAVLDQITRWDSEVQLVQETRGLSDGREVEVQTLYLGLAQALYAGAGEGTDVAGIGVPTPRGWSWKETPDHAGAISTAIRQYTQEAPAAFTAVPIDLQP